MFGVNGFESHLCEKKGGTTKSFVPSAGAEDGGGLFYHKKINEGG